MTRAEQVAREPDPIKRAVKLLGPGFITGAADDDPSGIGTYAVAGASLGMLAARNKKVMGTQTIGPVLTALGWIVTSAMFVALIGLALTALGS